MTQKGKTADERFLIKLYEMATQRGNPFEEIDFREVAHAIGQKETAMKNIVKHLAQANFIKKSDDVKVYLTQHGCNFVLENM